MFAQNQMMGRLTKTEPDRLDLQAHMQVVDFIVHYVICICYSTVYRTGNISGQHGEGPIAITGKSVTSLRVVLWLNIKELLWFQMQKDILILRAVLSDLPVY